MYYPSDWTHRTFDLVVERLRESSTRNTSAAILDLEDKRVSGGSLPYLAAGRIVQAQVGRVSTISVYDEAFKLAHFEGPLASHYMGRTFYEVDTGDADLGKLKWPTSTFVFDQPVREGALVTFSGSSKARLAQWVPDEALVVKAGVKITEAIKRVLEASGESRKLLNIPDLDHPLRKDFVVAPYADHDKKTKPRTFFRAANDLAAMVNRQLLPRPDGSWLLRQWPTKPVVTFTTAQNGRPGTITVPIKTTGSFENIINRVIINYGKDLKQQVHETPPAQHPFSPHNPHFSRRGKPRFLTEVYDRHHMNENQARRAAKDLLRKHIRDALAHTTACFPFPFLEAGDIGRFETEWWTGNAALTWDMSLIPGEDMQITYGTYANLGGI